MKRILIGAMFVVGVLAALPAIALADKAYHTEHLELMPVDDAPLRSGFVNNIHANGPAVYAHEVYVLNGAAPRTNYQVILVAYAVDPACEGDPAAEIPTAQISTNAAGNGKGSVKFTPEDVDGFRNPGGLVTHGIRWEVWELDGAGDPLALRYETACTAVTLD